MAKKLWWIGVAFLASLWLASCSKAIVLGVPEEDSSSSSIEDLSSSSGGLLDGGLEVSPNWTVGSIVEGDTVEYTVTLQPNVSYIVQWDDSSDGSGAYEGDVSVQVYDNAGDKLWFLWVKDGFSVAQEVITANGEITVKLVGSKTGNYAIRVIESEQGLSVEGSSSSISWPSSSSLPSSSTSSVIVNNGGTMSVGRTWTQGTVLFGDTAVYQIPVTAGVGYTVQWMDDWDNIYQELPGGVYPTADVAVSAYNSNGSMLFENVDNGAGTPQSVVPSGSSITVKVAPRGFSDGTFMIRAYTVVTTKKALPVSQIWTIDSLGYVSDTIRYTVSVTPGKTYRVQWDDEASGSGLHTGDISVSAQDSGGFVQWSGLSYSSGYSTAYFVTPATSRLWVKVVAPIYAGNFGMRVYEYENPRFKKAAASPSWVLDTMAVGTTTMTDTVVFKFAVTSGSSYRLQVSDYDGGSSIVGWSADVKFNYKQNGTSVWPSMATNYSTTAYATPISIVASSDTILVKVTTEYTSGSVGAYGVRLYEVAPPVAKLLLPSATWDPDTISSATDTILYKVPMSVGSAYRLQVDQYYDGTGTYNCWTSVSYKAKSATTWGTSSYYSTYSTPISISAVEDTMLIRIVPYSYVGTYAIRVLSPIVPTIVTFTAGDVWVKDTLVAPLDTTIFKVKVEVGKSYRINMSDYNDGSSIIGNTGDMMLAYKNNSSLLSYSSFVSSAYTSSVTVTPTTDTLLLKVTGQYSYSSGTFGVKVSEFANKSVKFTAGDTWVKDTISLYGDTTVFKVKVEAGKSYRINMSDYDMGSSVLGNAGDMMIAFKNNGDLNYSSFTSYAYSTSLTATATTDTLLVKVTPESSYYLGAYAVKVTEKITTVNKALPLGLAWDADTIAAADTVIYHLDVDPNATYRIQWDDAGEGTYTYSADVRMYYKESGALTWTGFFTDGYSTQISLLTSGTADSLLVKVLGQSTTSYGTFGIRTFSQAAQIREVNPTNTWDADTLVGGDTITYRMPTTIGKTYRLQWADGYQGPASPTYSANVSMHIYNKAGAATLWASGVLTSYADGYGYSRTFVATEDSLIFKAFAGTGTFAYRVFDASGMYKQDTIQVGDAYLPDSVTAGDTLLYKVPVTIGSDYQIQWNDANQGSSAYTGKVAVKASSVASGLTNYFTYVASGYTTLRKITATTDTLYLRVAASALSGAGGNFAIKVSNYVITHITLPVTSVGWTSGTMDASGQVIFKATVTPSVSYTIRWNDSYSGSGVYTLDVKAYWSNDGITWLGGSDSGYSTGVTFTPTGAALYVKIAPYYSGNLGTFGVQVY
jgi:hypothetical protein